MYILKNALKSITRTKWRNVLIGVIIVIIAISSCISLSIKNSANKLIDSYTNSSDVLANISINRNNMQKEMKNMRDKEEFSTPQEFMKSMQNLSLSDQIEFAKSEYVKSYYYTNEISLNGNDDITKVSMDMEFKRGNDDNFSNMGGGFAPQMPSGKMGGNTGDFTLIGYSDLNSMSEFIDGSYKISEGKIFEIATQNVCVISNELAEENEIKVGDSITLVNPNKEDESYSVKVTGIYTDSSESENSMSLFSNSANKILTNAITVENIVKKSNENEDSKLNSNHNVTYVLNSKDVIENFENELKEKGVSENYAVTTNLETIENELKPIKNLSTFSTTLLIIVLSVGGIILIVINMINIRERKYEIGVLRSIGMKKSCVLIQFLIELLIVAFIAIIIGTLIGSFLTVPVSNKLLESEIESTQEKTTGIEANFGMPQGKGQMGMMPGGKGDIRDVFSGTNYVDKLDVIIDIKTILQLGIIGIALTIFSSIVSVIVISRYSPLKILNTRT